MPSWRPRYGQKVTPIPKKGSPRLGERTRRGDQGGGPEVTATTVPGEEEEARFKSNQVSRGTQVDKFAEKARKVKELEEAVAVVKGHGCTWMHQQSKVRVDFYDARGIKAHWWPGLNCVDVYLEARPAARPNDAVEV